MTTDRSIFVRLVGPLVEDGRIPLRLLAAKVDATQALLFNVATSIRGGGRRGKWRSEVLEACELYLVDTQKQSFGFHAELPTPVRLPLPQMGFDLGLQSLDRLNDTIEALADGDEASLQSYYPDQALRERVLASVLPVLPTDGDDYVIEFGVGRKARRELNPSHRSVVQRLLREHEVPYPDDSVVELTGVLYLIEVETGQRQLGLLVNNRKISCFLPPALEPLARDLVPGSLVEVRGRATFRNGQVENIEEVYDALPVRTEPLHWKRLVVGGQTFHFHNPIVIDVKFENGLLVHEYAPLGIVAYAKSRRESLDYFRSEFLVLWEEFGLADDSELTRDAIELKGRLRSLVAGVDEE